MEGSHQTNKIPKNHSKTIFYSLFTGVLLIVCGFLAGWYWQNATTQDVLRVEISREPQIVVHPVATLEEASGEQKPASEGLPADCVYIGSKNSDKYHSPKSGSAARIKAENRVCFESKEDAEGQGYEAGTIN